LFLDYCKNKINQRVKSQQTQKCDSLTKKYHKLEKNTKNNEKTVAFEKYIYIYKISLESTKQFNLPEFLTFHSNGLEAKTKAKTL
jgi:hypothetical protein